MGGKKVKQKKNGTQIGQKANAKANVTEWISETKNKWNKTWIQAACAYPSLQKKMKHQIGRFWFSPWFPVISSFLLVAVLFIYECKYSTWRLPFGKKALNTPSALGSPAKYLPTKQS